MILALTFRTILVIINVARGRGDRRRSSATRCSASGASPRRSRPRTSRRSSTTRSSKAVTSSACCAGRCCSRRSSRSSSRSTGCSSRAARPPRPQGFEERADRARRGALRQRRRCRRTTTRSRCSAPTATAPTPAVARRRSRSRPTRRATSKARPVSVTWKAPALNTVMYRFNDCTDEDVTAQGAELHPGRAAGQPHHHLRQTGHPDAGLGHRGRRPEERPGDQRHRRLPQEHPALAGQGEGPGAARTSPDLKAAGARTRSTTREANLATAQDDAGDRRDPEGRGSRYSSHRSPARAGDRERSKAFADPDRQREPGRAALRRQLRPVPHQGLVVQRPGEAAACRRRRPAGSGAFGPSLRDGAVLEQFPGLPADDPKTPGFQKQYDWVSDGVEADKGYGVRGHLERAAWRTSARS